jgi:hypothetical protein
VAKVTVKTKIMKRILIAIIIMIGVSQAASAQTSGSNSSNSPSVSSSTAQPKNSKGKAAASDTLNDRKMYNWKDGQRATPTGHEATGTNGGYAALGRDSALATRRDSTKQQ